MGGRLVCQEKKRAPASGPEIIGGGRGTKGKNMGRENIDKKIAFLGVRRRALVRDTDKSGTREDMEREGEGGKKRKPGTKKSNWEEKRGCVIIGTRGEKNRPHEFLKTCAAKKFKLG